MSNGRTALQAKTWQDWGESCNVLYKMWCMFLAVCGTTWGHNMMEERGAHQRRDEARELAKTEH